MAYGDIDIFILILYSFQYKKSKRINIEDGGWYFKFCKQKQINLGKVTNWV